MIKDKRVLIVDDDIEFQQAVASFLVTQGCFVMPTKTCQDFLTALEKESPDIALIDKEIGFEDGFDLIHAIRKHDRFNALPVIVITGKATEPNKHEAIQIGADDLLAKPVSLKDLKLRMTALFRRSQSYLQDEQVLSLDGIKINLHQHLIKIDGQAIDLTKTEYKLFTELALKKGQILSREMVAQKFLSLKNQNPRTIDVHMTSLRKKLGDYGRCIKTVRGRGYMFHLDTH